jgi:hypothetical protein
MKMLHRTTMAQCSSFGPSDQEGIGIVFVPKEVRGTKA